MKKFQAIFMCAALLIGAGTAFSFTTKTVDNCVGQAQIWIPNGSGASVQASNNPADYDCEESQLSACRFKDQALSIPCDANEHARYVPL